MLLVNWLVLCLGAALGAVLRFFLTNLINKRWKYSFPVATFFINMVGAFLLGLLYAKNHGPDQSILLFMIGIGFLGAFTTFSTFTYETAILLDRRALIASLSNVLVSVILGLFFAWLATVI